MTHTYMASTVNNTSQCPNSLQVSYKVMGPDHVRNNVLICSEHVALTTEEATPPKNGLHRLISCCADGRTSQVQMQEPWCMAVAQHTPALRPPCLGLGHRQANNH
jgi:hypothetical protein